MAITGVASGKLIRALHRVAVAANEAIDVDEAMRACVTEVCRVTGWPFGHAYLSAEPGSGALRAGDIWYLGDPVRFGDLKRALGNADLVETGGVPGHALATGRPAWSADIAREAGFRHGDLSAAAGVVAACAFPALVGAEVVAVLEFFCDSDAAPDAELMDVLAQVGMHLGRVVERGRAYGRLRRSQQRLRNLVDGSIQGLLVFRDDTPVFANQALVDMLGYDSVAELLSVTSIAALIHQSERAELLEGHDARLRREHDSEPVEFRALRKDGSEIWMEARPRVVDWDGEVAVQVVLFDIGNRKHDERMHREIEERYRRVVESSTVGLFVHRKGKPIFANAALAELLGYESVGAVLALDSIEVWIHPDDLSRCREYRAARYAGRPVPSEFEMRVVRPDGSIAWISCRPKLIDWKGEPATEVAYVDITARKLATESRLAGIVATAAEAIISIDVEERIGLFNGGAERIFGYAAEEVIGKKIDLLIPERFRSDHSRLIAKFTASGESHRAMHERAEVTGRRKDGREFPAEASISRFAQDGETVLTVHIRDVSEAKRFEAAFRDSEQRFRDFVETASDWYWETDAEHRFRSRSEDEAFVTGDIAPAPGKTRFELRMEDDRDDAKWDAHRADLEARRPFRDFTYRLASEDGTVRYISVNGKPIHAADGAFLGYRGTGSDITARKRAEKAVTALNEVLERRVAERTREVEEKSALLQATFDGISEAFALYDAEDRLLICNENYRRFAGSARDLVVPGMTLGELIEAAATAGNLVVGGAVGKAAARARMAYHANPVGAIESRLQDGRWLLTSERRIADGMSAVVQTDITDLKRSQAALVEAKEQADAANQAKSQFLSSMSHELRTPLNAVLGFAQLLRDYSTPPLSEEQSESVDQILLGGKHLRELIHDVLDLAKIEAGGVDLSLAPVAYSDLCEDCLTLTRRLASERGVTIIEDTDQAEARAVTADPTRLRQVFLNLLSNAVKYNREGGTVTISCAVAESGMLRISVADTGIGIAAEYHDKVFLAFARLGAETTNIEGTGIGLTISRQLIEAMGGSIGFDSVLGQGSTFWFDIPLAQALED